MPIYNSTLLRIHLDDECIRMRTHSRRHPHSSLHILYRKDLELLLTGQTETLIDHDLSSFLRCRIVGGNLHFGFFWMNSTCRDDGSFTGWSDFLDVPVSAIREMLDSGDCQRSFLHIDRKEHATFDFSRSQHLIASIIEDKLRKRAFSKAMRNGHAYYEDFHRMYTDFIKHSFYFVVERSGKRRYDGGLILSTERRKTPVGIREALVYNRHT